MHADAAMENIHPVLRPPRKEPFVEFPLCIKALSAEAATPRYLVYKDGQDFVSVAATSADEAVRMAEVDCPLRIIREDTLRRLMLDNTMFG